MTRLVLHIGGYRTGSTAIQTSLFESRRLLRSHGILYPSAGLHTVAHHHIGLAANGRDIPGWCDAAVFDDLVDDLMAETRNARCDAVIVSTESLMDSVDRAADDAVGRRLDRLLSLFSSVDVLCCVRHQAPLLESLYRFQAMWPVTAVTLPFPDFVHEWMLRPHLTYTSIGRFFRALRPDVRVRYWSFSEAVGADAVVRRFHEAAGIEEAYHGERRMHESRSREATLALLEWNRSRIGGKRGRKAFQTWATAAFPEAGRSLFDADLLRTVNDRFQASNALLEMEAGIRFLDTPTASTAADTFAGHVLQPDDLDRVRSRLHARRWPWPLGRFPRRSW
jgi:hypothetical protein